MERFIHRQNLKLLKKQLEAPTDDARRRMLLRLLAEEEAKNEQLGDEDEQDPTWRVAIMAQEAVLRLRQHRRMQVIGVAAILDATLNELPAPAELGRPAAP